jgi:hypothetical protein
VASKKLGEVASQVAGLTYYDMEGKEITHTEWQKLFEAGEKTLERTEFEGGGCVSTVWLGMTHAGQGRLNIFETMVFGVDRWDSYQQRYDTKEEALEGHKILVETISKERKTMEQASEEFLKELKGVK